MTRIPGYHPVVIFSKKSLAGRVFSNTWHFHIPSAADSEARVAYALANISPMLNVFERNLHGEQVTLINHYIGDTSEQRPPGLSGDSFFELVAYGNNGLLAPGSVASQYAPLNTALLLKLRVSSERSGFKFIKGRLFDTAVQPGGRSGVTLDPSVPLTAYNTELANALNVSGMGNHLGGGSAAGDWVVATAHYAVVQGTKNRYVDHMSVVTGMGYVGATARQVDRRRTKRKPKTEV